MSHPRIEEVSDSDPDAISDPEEVDLGDFDDADILRRVPDRAQRTAVDSDDDDDDDDDLLPSAGAHSHILNPAHFAPPTQTIAAAADRSVYSNFQCLYPVYFDASRSRAEGRRVSSKLAVKNPLARDIANACSRLRLQTLLEPEKIHPKDWANPGRVKVGLKQAAASTTVLNKHHLYILVAQHLQENPTTESSAGLRLRIGGQMQPPRASPILSLRSPGAGRWASCCPTSARR
ncbi:Signal recognition particle SEC65 subunit [Cladobotryum mycophilum]|uniref:Signal recognition particle SEC65 subunit n=1 Tax=Cladobotryum mycophilum TaxID=491253 RepID=A0ABR0SY86_9HYPO